MESKDLKVNKSKKKDKKPADPHREFLDMDTDEEDLSRQESSESDDEAPPEMQNPTFTERELTTLAQYVQDVTVLSNLREFHWNEECLETIHQYFKIISYTTLTVFFNSNKLTASLEFPFYKQVEFMYFLRSPLQIYTVDNFLDTVTCGSVKENATKTIFHFLQNLYAPLVVNYENFPKIAANTLFSNLHDLLMYLNEQIYGLIDRTILYVPEEHLPENYGFQLFDNNEFFVMGENKFQVKELINRLEKIVQNWMKQIRETSNITTSRRKDGNVTNELNHWKNVYINLNGLSIQLTHKKVKSIIKMLESLNSPCVKHFSQLSKKLQEALTESLSNAMYLKVLTDHLSKLDVFDEIENNLTKILFLMFFIWVESPFYNVTENIEALFHALSTQIIFLCQKHMNLNDAFGNNIENSVQTLKKCISSCQMFKTIYKKFTKDIVVHISPQKAWSVNEDIMFSKIDVFIQRCHDIKTICDTLMVFGRSIKIGAFGGAKGTKYELYCEKIENFFYKNLDDIIMTQENILDVNNTDWHKIIRRFRHSVVELENMVQSLINCTFQDVQNIEEGIEIIYALQRFKYRPYFRNLIDETWIQVWKLFDKEIQNCVLMMMETKESHNSLLHSNSTHLSMKHIRQRHLKMQYTAMLNASYWIGECVIQKYVLNRYKNIIDMIVDVTME